ncbi:MAG TPA: chloride channel protein [Fibrobacteraceae bacterium]|nr:chloride channel protein [Fibrobacteraceae bacterium]
MNTDRIRLSILQWTKQLAFMSTDAKETVATVIQSLAAATGAVIYLWLINAAFQRLYVNNANGPVWKFVLLSLLISLSSAFITTLLMRKFPDAAGSGIPQAKLGYWKELGYIPLKTVFIKFFAGIISVSGGSSLGREGPTVYLGSGIASTLDGVMGSPKRNRRAATAIGASAGLAAAFNTPLAAITFCIEEMIGDLNTKYLGRVVLASLVGALTVYGLIGRQPSFSLPEVAPARWFIYFLIPLVALLASLQGVTFQKLTLKWRGQIKHQKRFPVWLAPVAGASLTWLVGISVFLVTGRIGIFGLGYGDLSSVLHHGCVWWVALVLTLGKLVATIFSYAFGGCGGIFSPTLFIGGLMGAAIASIGGLWLPITQSDLVILAAVGMSACMGSAIQAPLTSTLIVFEMTHQFELVPALIFSAAVSILVSKFIGEKNNFYDAILLQDGHELLKIKPPANLQAWQDLPISGIMNPKPFVLQSLESSELQKAVNTSPYRCFPYVENNQLAGMLTRESINASLKAQTLPKPMTVESCSDGATIHDASRLFINIPSGFLVIVDERKFPIGVVTLHDLLRAQVASTE